ncbi:MAG TPA: TetR/AcrR family transcriptional regulator [Bordetella sp.]
MQELPKPRKTPRQGRSQAMVEAILEATARVLAERGYAGTNTNVVAERAGVSVGSVYQYFPNKDALIAALHERHAAQMHTAIDAVLVASRPDSLRDDIAAIVHALMAAHQAEPALHKVLEREFPFFDMPDEQSPADANIHGSLKSALETHRHEITPQDLDLATWLLMRLMESLVHAAIIDPPARFSSRDIEQGIIDVLMGYLLGAAKPPAP